MLTSYQKNAIDFFIKNNYVIVQSPRRYGKTMLLKEISRLFYNIDILLLGTVRERIENIKRDIRNMNNTNNVYTQYFRGDKIITTEEILSYNKPNLIISDECIVQPSCQYKCASVFSGCFNYINNNILNNFSILNWIQEKEPEWQSKSRRYWFINRALESLIKYTNITIDEIENTYGKIYFLGNYTKRIYNKRGKKLDDR